MTDLVVLSEVHQTSVLNWGSVGAVHKNWILTVVPILSSPKSHVNEKKSEQQKDFSHTDMYYSLFKIFIDKIQILIIVSFCETYSKKTFFRNLLSSQL